MKFSCRKCFLELPELIFTEEQKLEIWSLVARDLRIFAVDKLIREHHISHAEAKAIVAHINNKNGHCTSCNDDRLTGENAECPQCGAFNYNIAPPPFNEEFCTHLEWKLDFDTLEIEGIKGYWCDGIDHLPDNIQSLSASHIREHKEIVTNAWIGQKGENRYAMTIRFGAQALKCYLNNQSLIPSIPEKNDPKWIDIQPENHCITILLN